MATSQLDQRVRDAVKFFWSTRADRAQRQGSGSGAKDAGARAAVTGGAQMDGFVRFVRDLLLESGLPLGTIHHEGRIEILGWYRSEKMRERLYDAACFMISNSTSGPQGIYQEPSPELSFKNFVVSLLGRAKAAVC